MTQADTSVVIRLLDHQLVGPEGWLIGKVDDLLLRTDDGGRLHVIAVISGPGALARRYPGLLGQWWGAVWRRFSAPPTPRPAVVPLTEVTGLGSDVRVTQAARDVLLDSFGLENWLRDHVVSRIPGARGDARPEPATEPPAWALDEWSAEGVDPRRDDVHTVGDLLQMSVADEHGRPLGRVTDVQASTTDAGTDVLGPMRVTGLLVGSRTLGSTLGYSTPELSGPAVVRRIVTAVHRHARPVGWDDVERVEWDAGRIVVREPRP
ncbi:hypothetical protein [Luteipulveratus halotolerans]|uniref:hypothetical protein n=1 Tax=Luteipulveratus halotolerans TaxID=1631356 RepID=UPI0012F83D27|nr:hypothetical protein [Luteipulveratus halotolerans]